MCGRYASSRSPDDLTSYFRVEEPAETVLPPSYNVAPTDPVYTVLERDGARLLKVARWGLIPSWAKEAKVGSRFINARRETVATTPVFRSAYARRRCLVPADGYFEWQPQEGRKQPYYLSARDGAPLAMAGLYEIWTDPAGERVWSCTIVTTSAPDEFGQIHDRTPLLVPQEGWAQWLDREVEDPHAVLQPGTPGLLQAWPVGPEVGNVRSEGPSLVQPV